MGSPGTGAFVGIDQVNAGAPVLAGLGETFIDLHRAVGPQEPWHALRRRRETREEKPRKKEEEDSGTREGQV